MTVDGFSLSYFNKRAIGSMFLASVSQNAADVFSLSYFNAAH
jgi:hypothetical protein